MSLDYLIVYESDNPKTRMGSENDGGYIIVPNLTYDGFISCGIADDTTFEKEFCNLYPNITCLAYDGTIDKLPEENARIIFIKKNIDSYNSNDTTNLLETIEKYNDIFLKVDIEGFEYQWLNVLTEDHMKRIKQLVIEFHLPFTEPHHMYSNNSVPVNEKQEILKKLANTHTLIHLHPNNCCGTSIYNDIIVPNVFECTYLRKDVQSPIRKNKELIPTHLDRPNLDRPEIELTSYPFVDRPYIKIPNFIHRFLSL